MTTTKDKDVLIATRIFGMVWKLLDYYTGNHINMGRSVWERARMENMPLDLQRGSKFAILSGSIQVKRKHAAGSPERVKACRTHEGLRTSQTEACRWISREGQSLPCSWGTVYRPNGNMPLDLQKGSKFTVLIRDPYKQNTESMPLDLQRGSKFPVLAKDTIYTALLLSFFERKPWRIDPKPYVQKIAKRTLKDDLILKKPNGGQGMEEKRRKKLIRPSSNESCYLALDGWIPIPHVREIRPCVHAPNSLSRCHDYRPLYKALPFPMLSWIPPATISTSLYIRGDLHSRT